MKFQQGTLPWLLKHELRLWWRGFSGKWIVIGTMGFFGILVTLTLVLWLSLAAMSDRIRQQIFAGSPPDSLLWTAGGLFVFLFVFSLLSSINRSLAMMFDRSDLDLQISSPVSTKTVLASQLLGVAIENFLGISGLILLPSFLAICLGFIQILASYPALFATCIITSSLGILINLTLVKLLGASLARTAAQFIGYVLSIGIFLLSQSSTLFQAQSQAALAWWSQATLPKMFFHSQSWIWIPARAILADLPALILLVAGSALVFWLTVEIAHRAFIAGIKQSLTTQRSQSRSTKKVNFNNNFNWLFLIKEWRSIARNPYVLSRLLYAIIGFIPLIVLTFQKSFDRPADGILTVLSIGLPVVGATFTSTLGTICFSAEESPDLLRSAPMPSSHLRWLKLLAVIIPSWAIASPLFITLFIKNGAWFSTGIVFFLATACHALLSLWSSRPIALDRLFSNQQGTEGDYGLVILQTLSYMVFVGLALSANKGDLFLTLVLLTIELILMTSAYWRSRSIGTSLGF